MRDSIRTQYSIPTLDASGQMLDGNLKVTVSNIQDTKAFMAEVVAINTRCQELLSIWHEDFLEFTRGASKYAQIDIKSTNEATRKFQRLVREFKKIPRNERVCCEATRLDMESVSFLRETQMSKLP